MTEPTELDRLADDGCPIASEPNTEGTRMLRKKIYVSGAISKGSLQANLHAAHAAAVSLVHAGFAPLVPHDGCFWGNRTVFDGFGNPAYRAERMAADISHTVWLERDLPWVACSDAVLRLPGESVGADQETRFAKDRGIPVFHRIADLIAHFIGKQREEARIDGAHAASDCTDMGQLAAEAAFRR